MSVGPSCGDQVLHAGFHCEARPGEQFPGRGTDLDYAEDEFPGSLDLRNRGWCVIDQGSGDVSSLWFFVTFHGAAWAAVPSRVNLIVADFAVRNCLFTSAHLRGPGRSCAFEVAGTFGRC